MSNRLNAPAETFAEFPEKLAPLFQPKRYKVLYGGRGAGRSWGVARALLIKGASSKLSILCARELQKSLSESVHKLLSEQIEDMGLGGFYSIQKNKIEGANGTIFSFEGIKNNTKAIKSYEGVDICWVEEAANVSQASWGVLVPTIRKNGSEIWITFNPELETDYTYKRFVKGHDPEQAFLIHMTYLDNEWFPDTLMLEMQDLKRRDEDAYRNVWLGECLQMTEGVVYAKELRAAQDEGRITRVPWFHETPVETFWDLGHRDNTAIWFGQRVGMEYRLLRYYEARGEDIHHFLQYCQALPYTYGTFWLPHDAKARRLVSKRSIEEIVRASGRMVKVVPIQRVADGINATRMIFPSLWMDEDLCATGIAHLRRYKYEVEKAADGGDLYSREPVHDEHSDCADALRQAGLAFRGPKKASGIMETLERVRASGKKAFDVGSGRPTRSWMKG